MNPVFKRFCKTYLPGKGRSYFWGISFLLLTIAATTTIPIYLKRGINILETSGEVLSGEQAGSLFHVALIIIFLGVALAIFRVLSRIVIFYPGRQIESDIRQDYYAAITALTPHELARYEPGDLISRGTNDVTSIRIMLSMGVLHSINSLLVTTICLVQMFRISGRLSVFCLLPAPVVYLVVKRLSRVMLHKARRMQDELGKLSEVIREHFGAASLIAIFNVFDYLFERFETQNGRYSKTLQEHVHVRTVLFLLSANLSYIASFILLLFGARDVMAGRIDLGTFAAFSSYLGLMQEPLRSAGFLISILQRGEVCLERIFHFMDQAKGRADHESAKSITSLEQLQARVDPTAPLIEIKRLRFPDPLPPQTEDGSGFLLHIESLAIPRGTKLGIFGATGAGKTMLLKLLTGNMPVAAGACFFSGVDYATIHADLLRGQFAIVPQESLHFAKTIRENIEQVQHNPAFAAVRTQEARHFPFQAAYEISQLEQDVMDFPAGLDTLLGEQGINLSGGQRQRLSLFRALVKPHQVLVLDDIVSAVDHQTEKNILKNFYENLTTEDTVIFVSHRISALIACDEILILSGGKIQDRGTHEELLRRQPVYRSTYRHQVLEEEIEG